MRGGRVEVDLPRVVKAQMKPARVLLGVNELILGDLRNGTDQDGVAIGRDANLGTSSVDWPSPVVWT